MDPNHPLTSRFLHATRVRGNCFLGLLLAFALLACPTSVAAQAAAAKPKPAAAKAKVTAKKPTTRKRTTAAKRPVSGAKKPAARKPSTAARKVSPSKAKATSTAKRRSPVRRTTRRQPAVAAKPRVPLQPAAERLTEIQVALAKAGYLQGEPTGKWDDASVAAMKRFQQEHSIPASGKINSLSLIALGLGPVRGPAPGAGSVLAPAEAESPAPTNPTADR